MTEQTENRRRIDIITDPVFVADLGELELDTLRERRELADAVETELSFYRRLLHGRMDLLAFELRRRSGEETRSLMEALPEILAAGETGGGKPTGRLPSALAPDLPEDRRRGIDRVLADDFLARLPETNDEELAEVQASLAETEREVSVTRKSAQQVFDTIQAEILRRYEDGSANADLPG
jgi:hypothetical protein